MNACRSRVKTSEAKLAELTSIGLGGFPLAHFELAEDRDYELLSERLQDLSTAPLILGEGSNIIAADKKLDKILLTQRCVRGPQIIPLATGEVLLRVQGACRLPALLRFALSRRLSGLEHLCGIPGSVGGAVKMNAGSYGVSFGELVRRVRVFSPERGFLWLSMDKICFDYRSFLLPDSFSWFLITEVELLLREGDPVLIREKMKTVISRKKKTQPVLAKSAGCVFKNPGRDCAAGLLLDQAGLRGFRLGGMIFSPVHANFLVNEGRGSFSAAMDLIDLARQRVLERFGFALELEVKIWR